MRGSGILLAIATIVPLCLAASSPLPAQPKPTEPSDQKQASPAPAAKPLVDKFSIVNQTWHRYPGLAVADITFQNANAVRVRNAQLSCEIFDAKGKKIADRRSIVFQSFPPGKKKVEGIEFSLREKNAVPGSCSVIGVSAAADSD
jgi:hypothetical protein